MHRILPVGAGVRLPATTAAAGRIGLPGSASESVAMDYDTPLIDTEDLPGLLAQLAAVAMLELVARALVPAVGVWAA
jgi:hypothetical protein